MTDATLTLHASKPGLFARLIERQRKASMARVTRNELHRLSDRELRDIGLSRYDIEATIRSVG